METLWQDVRYGCRMLARNPGFTAVVLLVIGVGIGANTALFNALDQVYMRPLPVKKPHELASVQYHYRHGAWEDIGSGADYSTYEAYRDHSAVFSTLGAFNGHTFTLRTDEAAESVEGAAVSTNYFSMLGLRASRGRLLDPEHERVATALHPVAVISHRLWRQRFESRADVVGEEIVLDDQALTIIGVAPAGFTGTVIGSPVDVYLTLGTVAQMQGGAVHELGTMHLLGRLQPGIDRAKAQAALRVLDAQRIEAEGQRESDGFQTSVLVVDGRQGHVSRQTRVVSYPLALFLGIAALVLVIACANIANLQLARATTRQKEIAIRQALGGGRRRIMRQLLVESLILGLAAGVCGIVVAVGLDRIICVALPRIASSNADPAMQIHIIPGLHPRVLLFAMALSLGAGIAFGLTPALQMVKRDVVPALKGATGFVDLPGRRRNPHNLLVIGQIAVAVVVTVGSGLCLRNLIGLKRIDPGFDPAHTLVVGIDQAGWLTDRPELRRFMEHLRERVDQWPQAASTGLTFTAPLGEASGGTGMTHIEGYEMPVGKRPYLRFVAVDPGFFKTLGQTLLAGRNFTRRDGPGAPPAMIVNDVFARRYWPEQNPIGKHVTLMGEMGQGTPVREIVGVVSTVKVRSLTEDARPWAYFPLAQRPEITPKLLIRADGDPRSLIPMIRREAATIQPAPACDIRTVSERVSGLLVPQQILTGILNTFGVVGLLLSATGVYAVLAYAVRQRTREIGIRMALGAQRWDVLVSVLRRGAVLTILGLILGLGTSLAGMRLLTNRLPRIREWDKFFLHGIDTWDPLTYVGATVLVVGVALLACYVPARRAAQIEPMVALRCE